MKLCDDFNGIKPALELFETAYKGMEAKGFYVKELSMKELDNLTISGWCSICENWGTDKTVRTFGGLASIREPLEIAEAAQLVAHDAGINENAELKAEASFYCYIKHDLNLICHAWKRTERLALNKRLQNIVSELCRDGMNARFDSLLYVLNEVGSCRKFIESSIPDPNVYEDINEIVEVLGDYDN